MAKNKPYEDDHRQGAVRNRSHVYNPHNDRWIKRDADTENLLTKRLLIRLLKG